jgi:hypothetical protein
LESIFKLNWIYGFDFCSPRDFVNKWSWVRVPSPAFVLADSGGILENNREFCALSAGRPTRSENDVPCVVLEPRLPTICERHGGNHLKNIAGRSVHSGGWLSLRIFVVCATFSLSCFAAAKPDIRTAAAQADYEKVEREGIQYLQDMPASKIEKGLPNVSFKQWIEMVLGADLHWEMNDCGEGGDGPSETPVCITVSQGAKVPADISVSISIGNSIGGVIDSPELFYGNVLKRTVVHLAELPSMVKEMHK